MASESVESVRQLKRETSTDHPLQYKIIESENGERRLICNAPNCGRPIVGARTGFTGKWQGGRHG